MTPTQCFAFQLVRPPIQRSYPDHYFVGGRSHRHQQEDVSPETLEWLFVSRPIQDAIFATLLHPLERVGYFYLAALAIKVERFLVHYCFNSEIALKLNQL